MNNKLFFHYLSYLQYPLLLGALFFMYKINQKESELEFFQNLNSLLIFMGLAISFSTLQDTKKVSLKFEKKIWENPKYGKILIFAIMLLTLIDLSFGIFGYFISESESTKEVSFGTIVLGIGFIGFTKTAIEIFENHIKDG